MSNWIELMTPNGDELWIDITKVSTILMTRPPTIQIEGRHIVVSQESAVVVLGKLGLDSTV